jgi:hypothetical protein
VLGRIRYLAGVLIATAGALIAPSAPAGAVQTTTWGIMAAPSGGKSRAIIDHAANGGVVQDAVVVYNRTGAPITVDLSVIGASYSNGSYQFASSRSGPLAGATSLPVASVRLGPHQQARVPVTIHMPRGLKAPAFAAIAAESAAVNEGALVVQQRLVVLIKASPSSYVLPLVGHEPWLWGSIALIVLLGVCALAARELRRRRQSLPLAAVGV